MNRQFDLIIIGDSKDGNDVVKHIASTSTFINIAFVSREFKNTTTHDFMNVEYINDEVVLIDYKNRLFGCYLHNGNRLYSTHLVVASGLKYAPYIIDNKQMPGVINTVEQISKNVNTKNQQAVALGRCDADIKLAISAAKKYKHVYLCTESLAPKVNDSLLTKFTALNNTVVLPNASIKNFSGYGDNLTKVELDNYSTITCSAVIVKTDSKPETLFISDKLIEKDSEGFCITKENLESNIIPKCFAVGNCVKKSTKKMLASMLETILKDFIGG